MIIKTLLLSFDAFPEISEQVVVENHQISSLFGGSSSFNKSQ